MTENQSGRLYRAVGAPEVPNSIVALPNRKAISSSAPEKTKPSFRAPKTPRDTSQHIEAGSGISSRAVFTLIIGATAIISGIESYFLGDLGWFTRIAFISSTLYSAIKANPVDESAAWTAAPIAFALAVLLKLNLTGADIGNFIATQVTGLFVGLSEHMWVILGTTAAAWVIGRRHHVAYLRAKRAEARRSVEIS
ncbi:MAG: hypothetical protein RL038_940 [Actinomycetota bacterium]